MTRSALRGVVALDGPSGTGKSTVARRLAGLLHARYLDTGAMYRAVTLAVLRAGVDPADRPAVTELARTSVPVLGTDPVAPTVRLAGADIAADIRGPEVTGAVSAVAGIPDVRAVLIAEQRRIIAGVRDSGGGIVVEGRDIGSVVAPDAGLKVYLTASAAVRARRRSRQDTAAGRLATVDQTRADVDRRDNLDARTTPHRPATDAVELDTSDLTVDAVIAMLVSLVDERGMSVDVENGDRAVTR
ncbi:MAG TPA: (d)CMP kinase [Pseudonocardiaceae bacterium]|nr:(d)CMP kinase [Pseudonocardiaceae bacterium]